MKIQLLKQVQDWLTAFPLLKNLLTAFYWSLTQNILEDLCWSDYQKGVAKHFSKILLLSPHKAVSRPSFLCCRWTYNIHEYAIFRSHMHNGSFPFAQTSIFISFLIPHNRMVYLSKNNHCTNYILDLSSITAVLIIFCFSCTCSGIWPQWKLSCIRRLRYKVTSTQTSPCCVLDKEGALPP